MRLLFLFAAGFLISSPGWAQQQGPMLQAQEQQQAQEQAPAPKQEIIVPAGTHVPLTLTNPIQSKSAHKGDAVRAVTAFPVTIGTQLAIPAGTYLEGVIDRVIKGGFSGRAGLELHFTRMVFANGYNVVLDGATAQAKGGNSGAALPGTSTPGAQTAFNSIMAFQQPTQPPPPPKLGPSNALVTGIGVAVTAAGTIAWILLSHHRGDGVLFDSGYQFEMVLQNPLILDADRVAAALGGPGTL